MRFVQFLLPLATTLLLIGCGPGGNSFIINGEFTGMKAGELYLYNPNSIDGRIDTLTVKDGVFSYEGEIEDTVPYVLLFPNAVEHVIFVSPGKTIEYSAATNDLKNYQVVGSEENELMDRFRLETSSLKENQIKNIAKQYIKENITSPVAFYLFDRYFIQDDYSTTAELSALLKVLKKQNPNHRLIYMAEGILANACAMKTGNKVPDVSLMNISKEKRQLWPKKKSDYTLIFFWASWIRNSYDMLWRMRQLQSSNSERMRFVGISLDNERYKWEDQVRRDSLVIEHYCDGLSWSSPAIQKLGLGTIPYYVIVDQSHKVLVSGTDVEQMAKDVSKYVK